MLPPVALEEGPDVRGGDSSTVLERDSIGIDYNIPACTAAMCVGEDTAARAVDQNRLGRVGCALNGHAAGVARP